jgi:L-alanine-DL-glutamate epimerase-like enolase superfamily enzyme
MSQPAAATTVPAPAVPRRRTITAVTATPVAVPLATPVRWATREIAAREFVLVRIEAGDAVGTGYTYAGVKVARSLAMFIGDVIAPRIVGLPWDTPTRPWADLFQETVLIGRRGFAVRAMSAVDLALWDLLGQVTGEPVARLLGGVSDRVPAYASGGYYRPGDPLAAIDREIGRYLELGFRDVKIKVGGLEPEVDAARVERVRSLIGPAGRVALDANNRWTTPTEAIRFVRMVGQFDPWWIEEPLRPDDIDGHAEIARSVDIPVATGEIHSTRWDFAALIAKHAADILQPDAAVIGGISEWIKVAHAAAVFDLPVAPHWNHEVHVHLSAAVANCLTVEWFDLEQDIVNLERILVDPVEPHGGYLEVPERPGLGIRFDEDAVNRYAIR